MSASLEREQQLVEYLLGGLASDERVRLEERFFSDDALHEDLQATIDDVIHAYLSGALSHDDRKRFEAFFLASPRRRERLEFVRSLLVAVDRSAAKTPTAPSRRWALAAAVLLACAAALLGLLLRSTPPGKEQAVASPTPPAAPTTVPDAQRPQEPRPAPRAAAEESPIPQRSQGDALRVRLPSEASVSVSVSVAPHVRTVHLVVPMKESRPSFDAVLRTPEGREVWRSEGLARSARESALVLRVPATVLVADDYTLSVESQVMRDSDERPPVRREYRLRVLRER